MVNSFEYLGQFGGLSEVVEHTANFTDGTLKISSLSNDIPVDSDCLVAIETFPSGTNKSEISINGVSAPVSGGTTSYQKWFWRILRGVSIVKIRGEG